MKFTLIIAIATLIALQAVVISAQSSPEIERLTAEIAKNGTFDSLYVERGLLFTWNQKFIGPNIPPGQGSSRTIDENRAKALADADAAIKLNPKNYKAYYLRGLVKNARSDFELAAKYKAESNIAGRVVDDDNKPLAIVVRGELVRVTGFETLAKAKEIVKTAKEGAVIVFDKTQKKFFIYQGFLGPATPVAETLAYTPLRKALADQAPFAFDYEALKIKNDRHLVLPRDEFDRYNTFSEIADVVDAAGLSLIRKQEIPMPRGSKGVRLLLDSEIVGGNFDETLAIYKWLDKINVDSNDLEVVKITRKTNLAKMYRASVSLRPFVEKEMTRWKYAEEEKIAVRGAYK